MGEARRASTDAPPTPPREPPRDPPTHPQADPPLEPLPGSPAGSMEVGRPVATTGGRSGRGRWHARAAGGPTRPPTASPTPTMVAPRPGGGPEPPGTDHGTPDGPVVVATDPGDPTTGRRLLQVVGVVAVLVVVLGLAMRDGAAAPVEAMPVGDQAPRVVDAVPPTAIASRWDLRLDPAQSLVGLAVVDDRVLVAALARPGLRTRDVVTVTAHATLDGHPVWTRDVADATSAVVVSGSSGQILLPTAESDVATREEPTSNRGRVVALDERDGSVRWSVPLTGDNVVRNHPERASVVVHGADRVTEFDVATGAARHDFPVRVDGDGGGDVVRSAHLVAGTWVVPTGAGWDLVDGTAATVRSLPDPAVVPALVADLAVTADGPTVTARALADGSPAWSTTFDDEVVDLATPSAAVLAANAVAPTEPVVAVTVAESGAADGFARTTHLLDALGRDLAAVPTGVGSLDPDHVVGVEVDGETRLLCLAAPDWIHDPEPTVAGPCPDRLALLDSSGRAVARQDGIDLAVGPWPVEPVLTQSGPILHERGRLQLYRWDGLAPAWSIPVDVVDPQPVLVATSTRGVVVGSNFPLPATVAWYG